MAITLNDNIKINAGKPSESKYLNTSNATYASTGATNSAISISERHIGLTVNINNVEYWYKEGVADINLVEKKYDTIIPTTEFITGATNLGYFSGTSNVQRLNINANLTVNDGDYFSLYNYYYISEFGLISIGSPNNSSVLRRGYVRNTPLVPKSWIYSNYSGGSGYQIGWQLIDTDISQSISQHVSNFAVNQYSGTQYTETEWWYTGGTGGGFYNNAGNLTLQVYGDLYSGSSVLTIGGRPYAFFDHNNLHFRTVITDTPTTLAVRDDDSFIHISGATSILTAQNTGTTGARVYASQTDNTLYFRRIRGSGDTLVSEVGGNVVIYSSGGTGSISVVNVGGGAGVYSGTSGTTMVFRSIVGEGDTVVTQSGDTIIVNTDGSGGAFTDNITVSINAGKSFGKYETGDVIPASGKTANEVILLACFEAQDPTVNLSSSGDDVAFGESGKTVYLDFSYVINSLGASVATTVLEHRRGGVGAWSGFTITTGSTDYTHNIDDSSNRFNTAQLNYRYTVTDTAGGTKTTTYNVNPQAYAAPSMVIALNGSVTSPETQTVREKGNVISAPSGTITSVRSLVNITDWTLERQYDGGGYIVLASGSSLSTLSVVVPSTPDSTIPTGAVSIDYRLTYTDEYSSGAGGTQSIGFKYFSYWGYNTNIILTENQIEALANSAFKTSQALTWSVTAAISEYTYYAYPSTFSNLTSIIRDGIVEDITAWSKLTDVNVTNSYLESLLYTVYRTNAPGAYTGNNLVFS